MKEENIMSENIDIKLKKSSITKRLFRKYHNTNKLVIKSRFLRRSRHLQKKPNQINITHEDS